MPPSDKFRNLLAASRGGGVFSLVALCCRSIGRPFQRTLQNKGLSSHGTIAEERFRRFAAHQRGRIRAALALSGERPGFSPCRHVSRRRISRPAALLLALAVWPTISNAVQNGGLVDSSQAAHGQRNNDVFEEDISCKRVNDAFGATWRSSRVAMITFNAKPDGTLKPHYELRKIGDHEYGKYAFSTKWLRIGYGSAGSVGQRGPVWNACHLIGSDHDGDEGEIHYGAIWRSFPYEAAADIWITTVDGRVQKVRRQFQDDRWKFPFATSLDVFSYDPAQIEVPYVDGR